MKTHSPKRSAKHRRGFSLTELSVALVAGSTLMMLAVSMVHESFNWSSVAKQRIANDQSFDRLQRQLRSDVHLADDASITDGMLELKLPEERVVVYSIESTTIKRSEDSTDADENAALREQYRFDESLQFSLSAKQEPRRIVLSGLRITPLKNAKPPVWRHVEAVVGRTQNLIKEVKE